MYEYCYSNLGSINTKGLSKTHWALALVKGIREPHEVKKNLLTPVGIEPTTSALDLPLLSRSMENVSQS